MKPRPHFGGIAWAVLTLSVLNSPLSTAFAQNTVFTYQGLVTDNGTNFTGTGQFAFALVTSTNTSQTATATVAANEPSGGYITGYVVTSGGSGYGTPPVVTVSGGGGTGATATATVSGGMVTHLGVSSPGNGNYTSIPTVTIAAPPANYAYGTYWSNDGTSVNGSEPGSAVAVAVSNGLFTVALGDTTVANMTPIAASLFTQPDLQLRIWFSDGVSGFAPLSPVQNLTAAPYSAFADTASNLNGTLSASQLSGGVIPTSVLPGFQGNDNTIGGGQYNTNSGNYVGTIGGGQYNVNSTNYYATVGGGQYNANVAFANDATIGGGWYNTNAGFAGFIGGGGGNYVTSGGDYGTIAGGGANQVTSNYSTVGGGNNNSVTGDYATIDGGRFNTNGGSYGTIGGGFANAATGAGSFIGGGGYDGLNFAGNYASRGASVISGGEGNTNNGEYATIGGGLDNIANGEWATVGGGSGNTASGAAGDTVAGGLGNNSIGYHGSTVGGGQNNTASGGYDETVGGGLNNQALSSYATVPGGESNVASGAYSFAAGQQAQATNQGAFVWADSQNAVFTSTNDDSFSVRARGGVRLVTGGEGMTLDGQTVLTSSSLSGISIQDTTNGPNVVEGAENNSIANYAVGSTIGGGGGTNYFDFFGEIYVTSSPNTIQANQATIAGGQANHIPYNADYSTIGGGYQNTASSEFATVGGGTDNTSSYAATVSGGYGNTASGGGAFVGGGGTDGFNVGANVASGNASVIGGGISNRATNSYATVPGGSANLAGGEYSFAAGQQAQALHEGAFVWADSQNATFSSSANDTFNVRAQGGANFAVSTAGLQVTTSAGSLTMLDDNGDAPGLTAGAGPNPGHMRFRNWLEVWPNTAGTTAGTMDLRNTSGNTTILLNGGNGTVTANGVTLTSDRNAKENFTRLDNQGVLAKVAALPITKWNYRTDPKTVQHIGPMAQDFQAAFGLDGSDDKHISVVDEGGVALAAIQGLNQKLNEKDAEIQELKQSVADLKKMVRELAEKK
jgi:hypothetical protein